MAAQRQPFRRSRNRIIAGVCAGVAEWLGWQPASARMVFAALSILSVGIPGFIIYLVLFTIMPPPGEAAIDAPPHAHSRREQTGD